MTRPDVERKCCEVSVACPLSWVPGGGPSRGRCTSSRQGFSLVWPFCPQRPSLPDLFCPLVPHDMDISVPEFLVELPCYPPRLVTWRARRLKYWTRFAESPRCPSRNRGIPFGHVVRDSNCRVTLACRPHIAHSLSSIRRDRWMWVFIFEVLNPLRWEVLFEKTPCRGSAIA